MVETQNKIVSGIGCFKQAMMVRNFNEISYVDSNVGKTWIVLSRHRDEEVLNTIFASHTWAVPPCTKPYRFFRLLQTGHNSSNHNFLSCSGIELYGELYEST
jgi:hypothetical protein